MDKARIRQLENILRNQEKCQVNQTQFSNPGVKKCPKSFDHILCWEETPAGQWAEQGCPAWVIGFENQKEKARRFCEPDGTWKLRENSTVTYTNYTLCVENTDAKILKVI